MWSEWITEKKKLLKKKQKANTPLPPPPKKKKQTIKNYITLYYILEPSQQFPLFYGSNDRNDKRSSNFREIIRSGSSCPRKKSTIKNIISTNQPNKTWRGFFYIKQQTLKHCSAGAVFAFQANSFKWYKSKKYQVDFQQIHYKKKEEEKTQEIKVLQQICFQKC